MTGVREVFLNVFLSTECCAFFFRQMKYHVDRLIPTKTVNISHLALIFKDIDHC